MNDPALRTLIEWLRPRANWHWLVVGQVNHDAVQTLLPIHAAAQITVVVENDSAAETLRAVLSDERVTVRVDDYTVLRSVTSTIDASLILGALENAADPFRVVLAVARVTRLNGPVAAMENNSMTRRALWNWFLDARLNDVSSREFENFSLVRGSR